MRSRRLDNASMGNKRNASGTRLFASVYSHITHTRGSRLEYIFVSHKKHIVLCAPCPTLCSTRHHAQALLPHFFWSSDLKNSATTHGHSIVALLRNYHLLHSDHTQSHLLILTFLQHAHRVVCTLSALTHCYVPMFRVCKQLHIYICVNIYVYIYRVFRLKGGYDRAKKSVR